MWDLCRVNAPRLLYHGQCRFPITSAVAPQSLHVLGLFGFVFAFLWSLVAFLWLLSFDRGAHSWLLLHRLSWLLLHCRCRSLLTDVVEIEIHPRERGRGCVRGRLRYLIRIAGPVSVCPALGGKREISAAIDDSKVVRQEFVVACRVSS